MITVVSRSLSVHQEHELLGALERAGLNKDDAQSVIQSPENELAGKVVDFIRGGGINTPVNEDEKQAIAILGRDKVITVGDVAQKWGMEPSEAPTIACPEEVLRQCARDNKAGKADWRLVYVLGSSLRKQREIQGTDRNKQPCFYNNDWWLNEKEDVWATQEVPSGYRLLNLKLQFLNKNWQEQENDIAIAKLGKEYERAEEQAVAEAFLSIFMVKGERLMQSTYHWGRALVSGGSRVLVGRFGGDGLDVDGHWPGGRSSDVGVVVARKF